GVDLAEGETLLVGVSLGPTLVPVPPDLPGNKVNHVTAALERAGLTVGAIDRPYNEDVPFDVVLALGDPAADAAELPRGTAVPLTVSNGPAPREIPQLTGQPRDDAVAALEGLGLVVDEQAAPS